MEEIEYANTNKSEVVVKSVEEIVYAYIADADPIAKSVEEIVYANIADADLITKSVKNAHMTYVHVIVWSVHKITWIIKA